MEGLILEVGIASILIERFLLYGLEILPEEKRLESMG